MQSADSIQYLVIAADGQKYGPADMDTLITWCSEGRITEQTLLERLDTGLQLPAIQILPSTAFPHNPAISAPEAPVEMQSASVGNQAGSDLSVISPAQPPAPTIAPLYGSSTSTVVETARPVPIAQRGSQWVNTSGTNTEIPPEIAALKWNWGAFGLGWIWLCGMNRVMVGIALWIGFGLFSVTLSTAASLYTHHKLTPITYATSGFILACGLAIQVFLGIKGNSLAWRYRRFESVEHFINVQTFWAIAGIIYFLVSVVVTVLGFVFTSIFASLIPR